MNWAPWDIPSAGPPCKGCKHWKPQFRYIKYESGLEVSDGVVMCHADEMYKDFSCFRSKEAQKGPA